METQPDGTTDVYRAHYDGAVVIEHQDPNGETWFESNEVIGTDGKPVICPDGVPLRIDFDAEVPEPTPSEFAKARRDLPNGKTLVFNEYSGEFQVVDATRVKRDGVSVPAEQFVYQCGPKGEPTLVPLSEVDPRAADDVRRQSADQLQEIDDGLTGLGEDPAKASPPPEP